MPGPAILPVLALLLLACGQQAKLSDPAWEAGFVLIDVAQASGVSFDHRNGMSGHLHMVEMMGPGVALFDYDNDGDLDLYLVQGGPLEDRPSSHDREALPSDRLYRNDTGSGGLAFTNVTELAGLEATEYGVGVAAGDYDNDGWTDLYVTNYGSNQLWRNRGDGTFVEVTADSGVGEPHWSTSASFLDFDRDGRLDLFVANYIDFSLDSREPCRTRTGLPDYCSPVGFPAVADRILRNRGDGTFEDVSSAAGIHADPRPGLGVLTLDADDDGWPDIYVANDMEPNQLWLNRRGKGFENTALLAGCAVNGRGKAEASMGIAAGDVDGDGDEDLLLTHLATETHTLYRRLEGGFFEDWTLRGGLANGTLEATGFGAALADLDSDGDRDLLAANGAVTHIDEQARRGERLPLRQPNQLFRNLGGGRFEESELGPDDALAVPEVSRGLAVGDLDNDGDLDAVITTNDGPVRILENRTRRVWSGWVGLQVRTPEKRAALGASVRLTTSTGRELAATVRSDGSYISARDPRLLFALAPEETVSSIEVRWGSGGRETWSGAEMNRYQTLIEGSGEPSPER